MATATYCIPGIDSFRHSKFTYLSVDPEPNTGSITIGKKEYFQMFWEDSDDRAFMWKAPTIHLFSLDGGVSSYWALWWFET